MILTVNNINFSYTVSQKLLENVSFSLANNERVALFAPSGFGKSTLARILAGYQSPDSGSMSFNNKPLSQKGFCPIQLISQHPEKSVNPKWTVQKILNEGGAFDLSLLEKLDIPLEYLDRYPFELSGGELQRICIARALKPQTQFLIADEITTMLDSITQAKIWHFLLNEVEKRKMGLLVITHSMHLAKRVCTHIINVEKNYTKEVL